MSADFARDAFLEQWLGYPVFRLRNPAAARAAVSEAAAHPEWMVETRVPVDRVAALSELTTQGFRLIDTNVQLSRAAKPMGSGPVQCRFAIPDDERAVRGVAASSFSQTRFHLDPRIPRGAADRVKEEWVGNFFTGRRGQWMVVAEDSGRVSGFLQILRGADDVLVIDLIAVAASARGKGLATSMIAYASSACLGRDAAMNVGTQIANVGSLALYTRLGFQVSASTYVLHLHPEDRVR